MCENVSVYICLGDPAVISYEGNSALENANEVTGFIIKTKRPHFGCFVLMHRELGLCYYGDL